jgi:predicted DNA-binding transcriptional regulator YafY
MPNKNTIRRDYLIISRILQDDYPNDITLKEHLERYDVQVSRRTRQRDIDDIRSNFDIDIPYDTEHKGYYIDRETSTPDFDKLLHIIDLAESSDVMLSTLRDKRRLQQYVSISPQPRGKGTENIRPLLTAMEQEMVIRIIHTPYQSEAPKVHNVEPYLLKEFEGRWYLFGYCKELKSFRTFGLDRLSQIEITGQSFKRTDNKEAIAKKFDDVYGLIYEPNDCANAPIEEVKLRFSAFLLPYITSLPLHHSQYTTFVALFI